MVQMDILIVVKMEDNIAKRCLLFVNQYFRKKRELQEFKPDPNNLKLDRHHGIVKNFMRLTNKTLIGLNKIKINRWQWTAGFIGMGLGYLYSQLDQYIANIRLNYRPTLKKAVIEQILHNQGIKDKLCETLLQNVYTNPDIQYTLHQLLLVKAIHPQEEQLFNISKNGLIYLLNSQLVKEKGIQAAVNQMEVNTEPISQAALTFLSSQTMDQIVQKGLSSLFRGQMFYNLLARQFTSVFNNQLMRESNRQNLYNYLREWFVNW